MSLANWIGVNVVYHNNRSSHFDSFFGLVHGREETKLGLRTIWFACLSIWKSRNEKIFQDRIVSTAIILEQVKMLSRNRS
jgi:hypothetical protein